MRAFAIVLTAALPMAPLHAQAVPPVEGGRTSSLGQPAAWKGTASAGLVWTDAMGGTAAIGLQRDLLNPMLSLLALHGEAYVHAGRGAPDAGVRARLLSPFGRVGIGLDYRPAEGGPDLLLSAFHPVRRGGLLRDGSMVRFDWTPARSAVTLGVDKPVRRNSLMGDSRPHRDRVLLPERDRALVLVPLTPELAVPLAQVRAEAERIRRILLPLGPLQPGAGPASVQRELGPVRDALGGAGGASAEAILQRYHAALDEAFSRAAAAEGLPPQTATPLGRSVADGARAILLERVLLPYNRLLGQAKQRDDVRGFAVAGRAAFVRWLHTDAAVPREQHAAVLRVFDEVIEVVEENRAAARAQWRDSRFVWLPLQYALRPEQHDTQAKLDAIVELATGQRFTGGNLVSWVVNEQFQYQLSRTVRAARDYHVLWTHDFRGLDAGGDPDEMSFRHVVRTYLAALTERVREYDRTGRFPTYMILLDQWFYEVNRGRLWLTLLEDPLHHAVRLPHDHAAWQDSLAAAQEALRSAVRSSSLLQAQARQYGEGWLRNLVKVHVSITNPADPSFSSLRVVRLLPLPDNMMRDHRKIVFYDVTEEDPYSGEAIVTGAGIGEHYANLSWEDRSLLVRGPAILPLKGAARDLLMAQGIPADRLPHALLPRPRASDYDERVRVASERNLQLLRALQVHNAAGFADKHVNVTKAVLYSLMPAGSVMKIPDSLWNSDFWASLVTGCALRGVRVLVIAPAAGNAPADAFGSVGRSRDLIARTLRARELLAPHIDQAGGLLAMGLYASSLQVTDIPAKVRHVQLAFEREAWLRELFGFSPSVLGGLAELVQLIAPLGMAPDAGAEFEHDPLPKLHLKANFFASREAWSLLQRDEWSDASWTYMSLRVNQVQERSAAVASFAEYPDALADVGAPMVRDWFESLDHDTRERVIFYTLMGSHNQNSRSMVIDAEVGFLIAHWPAIIPYIDLVTLIGQTVWLETAEQLDGLLPVDTWLRRRLAHWVRLAL